MNPNSFTNEQATQLLNAQAHIWNHIFYFLNSMALKCAVQLSIPDAIQKHGKPITLSELAIALDIPPTKVPFLNRLMRLLVHLDFFSKEKSPEIGEFVFDLTINSQLLLKDHPLSQAPFALALLDQSLVDPAHHLSSWLRNDHSESPFHIAHGLSFWEHAGSVTKFNEYFNQAMASDARFVARLMFTNENESNTGLFKGIESLVDVGGGDGTMAKAIAEAYPELKCIVLDLPHVVDGLQGNGLNLVYVGGNMFEAIPHAQAVLLKWILHDWSDEDCIKILERCKEAIPSKDEGGKVIIIDIVMEDQDDTPEHSNTHLLLDMEMMSLSIGGKERTEEEWKKLFNDAGFGNDYKTLTVLGPRSIIEIYPL